ncbi:MAG: rubredoxin [Deltaproteobacteria bacterium]|nr:rubredoxin [Deltaproteobacteria bacterium]
MSRPPLSVREAPDSGPQPAAFPGGLFQRLVGLMLKHHLHPVSVHIPNGVLPVSVIFIMLAVFSGSKALQTAALYNMVFVVLTIPLVLFSGYIEWRNRYQSVLTHRFIAKIIAAVVVAITSVMAVVWWIMIPDVLQAAYPARWVFIALILIMLIAATVAGFIGGKLVFKD